MTVAEIRVSSEWLDLREPADAAARAVDLVEHLRRRLPTGAPLHIHDLACGNGAMGRWLAPLLPGRQRWIGHDRDADLLGMAAVRPPRRAADGLAVTFEPACSDITMLAAGDLAGATLITASALLDLLTADELDRVVDLCIAVGCPALLTLSVAGRVSLAPADPLDQRMASAFDAHQRRLTAGGRLLGPDAVAAAVAGFRRRGADVLTSPSPWRLGAADAALAAEWLAGWVGAACEHEPRLAGRADAYLRRRRAQIRSGRLAATVAHADILVLP